MSRQLTETLKALLVERKKETLRQGWGEIPPWVFANREREPVDQHNFRGRVWPKLLTKAGLRWVRIHDLRHTFASLLIQQGESLAYVKDQLGHGSIRITVDTYGHLMPGGNKAAVDKLDGLENETTRNPDATNEKNPVLSIPGKR
jgi:integrase